MEAESAGSSGVHRERAAERRGVCRICPRFCELEEGERGICAVRINRGGKIGLDPSGCFGGLRVEPVEAHAINHFLPGTLVLSVGRGGSNVRSRLQLNGETRDAPSAGVFSGVLGPEDVARFALELNCPSVALGGTDPAVAPEQTARIAKVCRTSGVRTVALTRGYMCPAPRAELFRHIDAARVELFAFKERFYWKYCDAHIAPVLDTLAYLANQTKVWLEIAVPLIPGENDTVGEIERLCRWASDELSPGVPLHFKIAHLLANRSANDLRRAEISAARAQRIAHMNGIHHAYTDDLFSPHGRTTACHRCGTPLIRREWYQVSEWNLTDDNRCPHCGAGCPGVFAGRPAAWAEWPRENLASTAA